MINVDIEIASQYYNQVPGFKYTTNNTINSVTYTIPCKATVLDLTINVSNSTAVYSSSLLHPYYKACIPPDGKTFARAQSSILNLSGILIPDGMQTAQDL